MAERLTRKELAFRLRVSTRTVDRMVLRGDLPYLRVGKLIFFSLADIEEWEAQQTRRSAGQSTAA